MQEVVLLNIVIIFTMLILGLILGFVGAGGSGFIIAVLTTGFGISIHTALGTSLAAMVFSTISGAISHYREGNVQIKVGIVVGLFGAIGAFIGTKIASHIAPHELTIMTAMILFLSGIMLWVRMFVVNKDTMPKDWQMAKRNKTYWVAAGFIGVVTGGLSGTFGIGSTPFIQIGLLTLLGMSVRSAAGTTMLIIIPIALSGAISDLSAGVIDLHLLVEVVMGTMVGTYFGAKFTKRVPSVVLRTSLMILPFIAGTILLL
jgi:uncharacterized membrane protein YfcA